MALSGARGQMMGGKETVRSQKRPGSARRPPVGPSMARVESGCVYYKQSSGAYIQHPDSTLPTHSSTKCI